MDGKFVRVHLGGKALCRMSRGIDVLRLTSRIQEDTVSPPLCLWIGVHNPNSGGTSDGLQFFFNQTQPLILSQHVRSNAHCKCATILADWKRQFEWRVFAQFWLEQFLLIVLVNIGNWWEHRSVSRILISADSRCVTPALQDKMCTYTKQRF